MYHFVRQNAFSDTLNLFAPWQPPGGARRANPCGPAGPGNAGEGRPCRCGHARDPCEWVGGGARVRRGETGERQPGNRRSGCQLGTCQNMHESYCKIAPSYPNNHQQTSQISARMFSRQAAARAHEGSDRARSSPARCIVVTQVGSAAPQAPRSDIQETHRGKPVWVPQTSKQFTLKHLILYKGVENARRRAHIRKM